MEFYRIIFIHCDDMGLLKNIDIFCLYIINRIQQTSKTDTEAWNFEIDQKHSKFKI